MKFSEEISERADDPPKKAIIYDENGEILWSNIDEIKVSHLQIKELFDSHYNLKKMFRGY